MLVRGLLSRVTATGEYRSPNICFIDDEADDPEIEAVEVEDEEVVEDEDDTEVGDEAEDDGEETVEDADTGGKSRDADDEGDKPRKRGASDIIRENKRRAQELQRERDDERRLREAAERRAEEAERRANDRRQETEQQERDRVALMTVEEQNAHYRKQDQDATNRRLQQMEFRQVDRDDKADFRQACRDDPLMAKVATEVETRLTEMRSKGQNVEREALANYLIGQMVRKERGKAKTTQRRRGEESVRRETTRPVRTRSSAAPDRQRRGNEDTAEGRRKRLEGVTI